MGWERYVMDTIGKYQILDTIGSGGFSVVFKGYDPDIKRVVAIKVCSLRDEDSRARFYHEAEIAGRLSHRNITAIFEFGVDQQTPFLVEEYLPGADLAQLIRRHEPEVLEEKLDVLLQIADGMAYAHRQGVIHRDIKPANVRVLDNGRVKILDFGTAKITGTATGLTESGMTLGTVAYLAPERMRGQAAQPSADVFAYGALAHELMAFQRAFEGDNIPHVIERILSEPAPSLADRCRDCPADLVTIIDRCLEKEATDRYPSGLELLADLEALRDSRHAPARPAPAAENTAAPALLARIESLFETGRDERALLLLEEALEIAPDDETVCRLAIDHGLMPGVTSAEESGTLDPPVLADEPDSASPATRPAPADDDHDRQQQAARSIQTLIDEGKLVEAARALAFASRLFNTLHPARELARGIVDQLRDAVVEVRHGALRQAHHLAVTMRGLEADHSLDPDLAEHLAERAEELAPGRTSVLQAATAARHRGGDRERDARTSEAIASIEELIEARQVDLAAKALRFAVDRYGSFEQADQLARRIDHARRAEDG